MSISRKNMIIGGIAGVAILVVTAILVVVLMVNRSQPGIFKRCDGSSEPVEFIEVSSCPDSAKDGYCKIDNFRESIVKMNFTPMKNYDKLVLTQANQANKIVYRSYVCSLGTSCPTKAGRQEVLFTTLYRHDYNERDEGQIKLNIYLPEDASIEEIAEEVYCVQFPVKYV